MTRGRIVLMRTLRKCPKTEIQVEMTVPVNPVLVSLCSVFSRSCLNVIDRHSLGIKGNDLHFSLIINVLIPLLLGSVGFLYIGSFHHVLDEFFTFSCFILSLVIQIVSYAFSRALKQYFVIQVIIQAKIADLFLPVIVFCLATYGIGKSELTDTVGWWSYALNLGGFIPLLFTQTKSSFLFNKTSLILIASLLLQVVVVSSYKSENNHEMREMIALVLATLSWRLLFTLASCAISRIKSRREQGTQKRY